MTVFGSLAYSGDQQAFRLYAATATARLMIGSNEIFEKK